MTGTEVERDTSADFERGRGTGVERSEDEEGGGVEVDWGRGAKAERGRV